MRLLRVLCLLAGMLLSVQCARAQAAATRNVCSVSCPDDAPDGTCPPYCPDCACCAHPSPAVATALLITAPPLAPHQAIKHVHESMPSSAEARGLLHVPKLLA